MKSLGAGKRGIHIYLSLILALASLSLITPIANAISADCSSTTFASAANSAYQYVKFATTSTTTCDWLVPSGVTEVGVVIVAGGGGGGTSYGGGGGAGGVIFSDLATSPYSVTASSRISVTTGAGGVGGSGNVSCSTMTGSNGSNSVFGTLTAKGGGGGGPDGQTTGCNNTANWVRGVAGGSGGGTGQTTKHASFPTNVNYVGLTNQTTPAGVTSAHGNNGGAHCYALTGGNRASSGGGGAGAVGGGVNIACTVALAPAVTANGKPGVGGIGTTVASPVLGDYFSSKGVGDPTLGAGSSSTYYIAGGGAGSGTTASCGCSIAAGDFRGGLGGGGSGSNRTPTVIANAATSGTAYTGGGGGGGGGSGGSGFVLIRYLIPAAPTVSSVSSTASNATYEMGDVIPVTIAFSKTVIVTGTPRIQLSVGENTAYAYYVSGSNSPTLTFNYTVADGDISSDLTYTSTSALTLNLGTIKDSSGVDATLTLASPTAADSLGANKAIVIDGIDRVAPTVSSFSSTTANGNYKTGDSINITATISKNVTSPASITVTLDSGAQILLNHSATDTTLTGTYTVAAGQSSADLTVSSFALTSAPIDSAGNTMSSTTVPSGASNIAGSKAIVIDGVAPTKISATVDSAGNWITIVYSEAISATTAATTTFSLTVAGASASITSITISGSSVSLILGNTIGAGQSVSLTYTDPTSGDDANAIQDRFGNDAAGFISITVTNSSAIQFQLLSPADISAASTPNTLKSITVTWTTATNANSYTVNLYESVANGGALLKTIVGITATTKTITTSDYGSLIDGRSYQISIETIGTGNFISSTQSVLVAVATTTKSATTITLILITGTPEYLVTKSITASTQGLAGTVNFKVDGKSIPGCTKRPSIGSTDPTYTATCTWKPAVRRQVTVTAVFTPSSELYLTSTSTSQQVVVIPRRGART
jgi:uncharacterized repeat protein (TIGR02059 family)